MPWFGDIFMKIVFRTANKPHVQIKTKGIKIVLVFLLNDYNGQGNYVRVNMTFYYVNYSQNSLKCLLPKFNFLTENRRHENSR